MAEYKYRALGWQDDDIASLNVVDGTAADNQVELQITKQGEGGKISGPAIIGKDGITIDKAADSEKIEISGKGLVQSVASTESGYKVYITGNNKDSTIPLAETPIKYGAAQYDSSGKIKTNTPEADLDCTNKKYVNDNYVKKLENTSSFDKVYTVKKATQEQSFTYIDINASLLINGLPIYVGAEVGKTEPQGSGRLVCYTPVQPWQVANKKYVDDNYVKKITTANRVYTTDKDGLADTAALAYTPIAYGLSAYDEGGRITTNEPVDNLDCANKKFVEDAVAAGSATVDGTSIVKDTDGKIQLNQEYIDYLDNQLYQPPVISVFTMLDAAGAALPTSNELGTTLSAAAFNHQETNIKNIQGDNVELHINNAAAATTSTAKKDVATKVTLTTAQSITNSTKFTLKGTNTKGAAFSRDYQVNFYRYAYTATTDATTAPTSGATQQAAVGTFASNGSTFDYTKGGYIYFYTDNTGKKVQTNVLGQWADVDTTDMGKVTLTQNNGATHEYTCYRIGPFIETGSAKYRV